MNLQKTLILGVTGLVLLSSNVAFAVTKATPKIKSFCLQSTVPVGLGGTTNTWYLELHRVSQKKNFYRVNGFELGENGSIHPAELYVDELVGTSVNANESSPVTVGDTLNISLIGTGSSFNSPDYSLWHSDYILNLDPSSLTGNLMGTKSRTKIPAGTNENEVIKTYTNENITVHSVACPESVTAIIK
jgi:hypothetical protein